LKIPPGYRRSERPDMREKAELTITSTADYIQADA